MAMKEIMNLKEVARYLGLNERTVYNLVKRGEIPASKIGRQWRVKKDNLDGMFKNKKETKQKGS
jgi:excisionase family DNA binding protein